MTQIDYLTLFSQKFWYAPADVLLRAKEGLIWETQKISSPSLDIGCGDGSISAILFAHFKPIDYGSDINPTPLALARKTKIYKKVIQADACKLPFKTNQFKTIISNSTFEHIENDLQAIKEVSRVLKPKGQFIFTVPSNRLVKFFNLKMNQRAAHYHYRSLSEWKKILSANNMKIIEAKYYFSPSTVRLWKKLFLLAIFRPYKRELWSYLQTSFLTPFWPKKLTTALICFLLRPHLPSRTDPDGTWLFIKAQKNSK